MCTDTKSNLDSLEDFILNQDKIVTYRWLSKELNIHTNTSKQLLYTFSLNNTEKKLSVTYLISGYNQDGDVKVFVVPESGVDKVKSSLDSVLSEHVYSVQKASSTLSSSDLYLADSSAPDSENKSSISLRKVEEREFKIIVPEKPSATTKQPQPSTSKPLQKNAGAATKPSLFNNKAAEKKDKETSKEPPKEKDVVAAHKSPVKSKVVVSPTKNIKKKGAQSKSGNIGALFSKQAEKKKNEPPTKKLELEEKIQKEQVAEDSPMEVDEEIPAAILENDSPEKPVHKTPVGLKKKQTKPRSKKRKNNKDEDNTPARKRKRIVLASDSDSEEEQEEEDVYVEEEPEALEAHAHHAMSDSEDEEEVIPPTPYGEKTKKKIRKQIDRTFLDEDGFVITKKEYVYVSCSDNEENDEQDIGSDHKTPNIKTTPKDKQSESNSLEITSRHNDKEPEHSEKEPKPSDKKPKHSEKETKNSDKESKHSDKESKDEDEEHKDNQSKTKSKAAKGKTEKKATRRKPKSPVKISPKSNNKQASIMSFFQKK